MKKIFIILTSVACLVIGIFVGEVVRGDNTKVKEYMVDNLLDVNEIEAPNKDSELYVDLNNELVKLMDDFIAGNISEEEYIDGCESIQKKIDSQKEKDKLIESEDSYREIIYE